MPGKPEQKVQPQISKTSQTPQTTQFHLSTILDSLQQSVSCMKDGYRGYKEDFQKSEAYTSILTFRDSTNQNFMIPLGEAYRRLPYRVTDWKFDMINGYTYRERLMAVNTLGLLTAVLAFRKFQMTKIMGTSLSAVKNTGVVYLLSGLIIAPEIYNPIMKSSE